MQWIEKESQTLSCLKRIETLLSFLAKRQAGFLTYKEFYKECIKPLEGVNEKITTN